LNHADLQKTTDLLRKEHQQALSSLIDLKEEYSSKLMIMSDKHEQTRAALLKENSALTRKLETLSNQILYMEKKEIKLFG
jgi:hypothetical protein